jgi:hypothetical protein
MSIKMSMESLHRPHIASIEKVKKYQLKLYSYHLKRKENVLHLNNTKECNPSQKGIIKRNKIQL